MSNLCESAGREIKYRSIAAAIKADILAGRVGRNERLPSFLQLQSLYGATPTTANQVYALLEREGLVEREPGRGIFVKSDFKTGSGIVAISGLALDRQEKSSYWVEILRGIESVASRAGLELLLTKLDSDSFKWNLVDGVLDQNGGLFDRVPTGMPFVSMLFPIEAADSVIADDYQGMRAAMEHLLILGHRRFAYLSEGSQLYWTQRRMAAYHDALREAGIEANPDWVRCMPVPLARPGGFRGSGRETMSQWLHDGFAEAGCTALLVHNDDAAFGVLEALDAWGMRVPRDLSVVGFDGLIDSRSTSPPLTTVSVPLFAIGARAMEIVIAQMRTEKSVEKPREKLVHEVLSCRLQVRESTGLPRS